MTRSDCDTARSLLPWFVGDDLSTAEFERVRQHLLGCMPCRNQAAGLQQARAALQQIAAAPVPGVEEPLFADLQRSVMSAVAGAEPGRRRRARWRPVAAAAAAMLLVGVGFLVGGAGGGAGDSVWQRSALSTNGAADAAERPVSSLPWAIRPLGSESWQRLEDADAEREFVAERFPELDAGRGSQRRVLRSNGLSVRSQLRSLVDTRRTSGR
ncbi:MAG: zf-HC2 domain-containing protein [Planctomycetes bacterium]|nr:zf-HC2 domain-containing protein [Planctomycetota bacterium]